MKIKIVIFSLLILSVAGQVIFAQQNQKQDPPTVSGFGTSFVFGPRPTCSGCIQTELGVFGQKQLCVMPVLITYGLNKLTNSDITVLFDGINKTKNQHVNFSNQLDVIFRKQLRNKNNWVISFAPRGGLKLREGGTSKFGVTLAAQYTKGNNVFVSNLTGQKLFDSSSFASFQNSFDYARIIHKSGLNFFVGFQQTLGPNQKPKWDTEQGLVIPMRNLQFEFEIGQLSINDRRTVQAQARILVNWGRIFK